MVSLLWDACSDGRLDDVHNLLTDASLPEIEVKGRFLFTACSSFLPGFLCCVMLTLYYSSRPDASGITPLIRAIQQGHVDVVRALLDKGSLNLNARSPPLTAAQVLTHSIRLIMGHLSSIPQTRPYWTC